MFLWVHYADMVIALAQLPVAMVAWRAAADRPSRTSVVAFAVMVGTAVLRLAAGLLLLRWGWEFAGPRLPWVVPALVAAATVYLVWVRPAVSRARVAAVAGAVGVVLVAAVAQLAGVGPAVVTGAAVLGATAVGRAYRMAWPGPASARRGRWQAAVRAAAGVALVAAVTVGLSTASALPARSSMSGGTVDTGGGAAAGHEHRGGISVTELTGADSTTDAAVRRFTLTAQESTVRLDSGAQVAAWTFNGVTPGPQLVVHQGDLVEVTLVNRLPGVGVTVHWHGVDVPNAMDGVAGVTQDAVAPGAGFVYRFRASQAGTYWYHSHEMSSVQVRRGLFGALVVLPRDAPAPQDALDETVLRHTWGDEDGVATLGLAAGVQRRSVPAGRPVRLRLVNTDGKPATFAVTGAPVRVVAIDGTDVHEPGVLSGARILVGGGARYDVEFTMPDAPVTLRADGPAIVYSPGGDAGPDRAATAPALLDPARYGTPAATPFAPGGRFDRRFVLRIDERLGFYDGRPAVRYTLNGASFPDVPMLMVADGDLVEVTYVNRSGQHHPMHLHGHHMLVLSRDGRAATGSPWWVDTLDVGPGETYRVAFRADNPGLWMDHCHDLEHAANGMILHLGYTGVTSPFLTGSGTPNHPE
ncbi:multicopper oxidase family protein [Dactylosporangium sp. CA-139066]|uniref:multicopper oxidase family protein n=1 Tax=Dactylosporangium sp. CA-139066 TaxID=3239930 RepID=UPI003D93FAAD